MDKGFLPAQPIIRLLKEAGVEDWDDRVVYQLLEFQHSMIFKLLEGAKEFAVHRGKSAVTESDLRMALELMESKVKSTKLKPKLGSQKRQQPLPGIQPSKKLRLPKTGLLIKDTLVEREEEELAALPKPSEPELVPSYNIKKSSKTIQVTLSGSASDQT